MDFKIKNLVCPIPVTDDSRILLAHGSGGTHMHKLLDNVIVPNLMQNLERAAHDSAVLNIGGAKLAFTTDSYVVNPIFFPGGNIGSLSVYGTVNDLAMSGAKPLYISVAFILEEGFLIKDLQQILQAIKVAAKTVNVEVVTGDTKVVERGKGHGIYINTAGIGLIEHNRIINPAQVQVGDVVIVSGDIGKHGIAIMAKREGLEFETTITSDSAPVSHIVGKLLEHAIEIHCLRDVTRGGLATTLNEIAIASKTHIKLQEVAIPVQAEVRNACDLLGLDALHIACEGRFVAVVDAKDAMHAVEIMRTCKHGKDAQIIGVITEYVSFSGVSMTNSLGVSRIVDPLNGEQLPRIC
jgi:hydrogenase expression/formation protein HypE